MAAIIRSYGIFWERDLICWGKRGPGGQGHLNGYASRRGEVVDFCDQRGIYVLYEGANIASQRVIYVGQTGLRQQGLLARLKQHRDDDLWNRWQRFSWFGLLGVGASGTLKHTAKQSVGRIPVATALDTLESVLISLFEPIKNKQGPRWGDAVEYFQHGHK